MGGHLSDRARTGLGKPGKSWNSRFSFPGLESHGILFLVLEGHGKLKFSLMYQLLQMIRQGQFNVERSYKQHIFWWTPEFVSVELFKVKKYPKTRKVLKIF